MWEYIKQAYGFFAFTATQWSVLKVQLRQACGFTTVKSNFSVSNWPQNTVNCMISYFVKYCTTYSDLLLLYMAKCNVEVHWPVYHWQGSSLYHIKQDGRHQWGLAPPLQPWSWVTTGSWMSAGCWRNQQFVVVGQQVSVHQADTIYSLFDHRHPAASQESVCSWTPKQP